MMENYNKELIEFFANNRFMLGRMISGSKSGYRERNPDHFVIFNANIISPLHGKIWHGDIDITNDGDKLREMAKILGYDLYVLYEHDARFGNENNPIEKLIESAYWSTNNNFISKLALRLVENGKEVFGDERSFFVWYNNSLPAFEDKRPSDMDYTIVIKELEKIKNGILS